MLDELRVLFLFSFLSITIVCVPRRFVPVTVRRCSPSQYSKLYNTSIAEKDLKRTPVTYVDDYKTEYDEPNEYRC